MDLAQVARNAVRAQHLRSARRKISHKNAWHPYEIEKVRLLFPDRRRLNEALPNRTWIAIRSRAGLLGLRKKQNRWLACELSTLRKMWIAGASRDEITAALPRFTWSQIDSQRKTRHIYRHKPDLKMTEHPIINQIKLRARELNLSMRDVDEMAHTGSYFYYARWSRYSRPNPNAICNAVAALDGFIVATWR